MIPASILLIILVLADAVSHIALWTRASAVNERAEQVVRDAYVKEHIGVVQLADYERAMRDLQYEIKRLRAWTKVPGEFHF